MVFAILFAIALIAAIYFAVRFYLLRSAIVRADGELKDINSHITQNHVLRLPVPDRALGALMTTINATLQKVREERNSYAERERLFRSQIEAISHDLRTPLTVIIGYLKLMRPDDGDREVILRKAQSMQKLIAAFYEYSRVIAGDFTIEMRPLDLNRTLKEVFADNCVLLEAKELKVITSFPDCPVGVEADPAALERVIVNLIQNAASYAKKFFSLTLSVREGRAVAIFENDAKELKEEQLPRIFDRFYMADSSRGSGGTGLGLTIAKNLVDLMGGTLTADLKGEGEGQMLDIVLTLPVSGQ